MEIKNNKQVLSFLANVYAHYTDSVSITDAQSSCHCSLLGGVGSGQAMLSAAIIAHDSTYANALQIFVVEPSKLISFANDISGFLPEHKLFVFPESTDIEEFKSCYYEALVDWQSSKHKGSIWIVDSNSLLAAVPDMQQYIRKVIQLHQEKTFNRQSLLAQLVDFGFQMVDFVYAPGQVAKRGGIIDIFSFGQSVPYRIEWSDDIIMSIRSFHPETQLSNAKMKACSILPSTKSYDKEENTIAFWEALPADVCFWMQDWSKQTQHLLSSDEAGNIKLVLDKWQQYLANKDAFFFTNQVSSPTIKRYEISQEPQLAFNKQFDLLIDNLNTYKQKGYQIFISCENPKQYERLQQIFEDLQTDIALQWIPFSCIAGFLDHTHKLIIYSDHEIFNRHYAYKSKRKSRAKETLDLKSLQQLKVGDYVTHIDYGIGIFSGLQQMEVDGNSQEVIRLMYRDNDTLYVNIHSLYKIAKYSDSKDGISPKVHKLGTDTWRKSKEQTKQKVKKIAFDLIKLYAERRKVQAYQHSPDNYLQNELESSFLYEETPDQAKAIEDVKRDMQSDIPMDRLVCGDVGFGKTEVAIRAAFKAVLDGKQVAILVPTTVLAVQHYHSFKKRMDEFSLRIEFINRFKTAKQKTLIKQRLKQGDIDIIIGTQALLAKDIVYKDLSLLVVDEEQKFGVSDKEKIKNIKQNVDALTLTATPIPRTLQLSLMGARDLSIIQTPPPNRQPPHTEIMEFGIQRIGEIIQFEVARGGQVFFIQNRIEGIIALTQELRDVCPKVAIEFLHGQLQGSEIEEKMLDFVNNKFDVLVATNIIESGLDIPNANTIIIHNAHHFGLSDIHQLRGRVGRSNQKSYCYLVAPPLPTLKEEQRKKLEIIEAFSDLGSGFKVAMKDLDLRGSGNILGGEQSGFMNELGFDVYHRILSEAVQELKEESFPEETKAIHTDYFHISDCSFETDLSIFIPDTYITNGNERIQYYKEINECKTEADIDCITQKMEDIFGPLPQYVNELFKVVRCRMIGKKLGFDRLVHKNNVLLCFFSNQLNDAYFRANIFNALLLFMQQQTTQIAMKQGKKSTYMTIQKIASVDDALKMLIRLLESTAILT